jgi:hypothetical protein
MMSTSTCRVLLYWLPLGAGGHLVRWNGRAFEVLAARRARRPVRDLYHSALEVRLAPGVHHVIEMAPEWGGSAGDRGAVVRGAVGLPWLGRSRLFRYEIRCWQGGVIPDVDHAVASPVVVGRDPDRAHDLIDLVALVPTPTWGLDELRAGEMWNSNSVISWLLVRSGHDVQDVGPPAGGRAPGWSAGTTIAARAVDSSGCGAS